MPGQAGNGLGAFELGEAVAEALGVHAGLQRVQQRLVGLIRVHLAVGGAAVYVHRYLGEQHVGGGP